MKQEWATMQNDARKRMADEELWPVSSTSTPLITNGIQPKSSARKISTSCRHKANTSQHQPT